MATESHFPDGTVFTLNNMSGAATDVDDDPFSSPDANWVTSTTQNTTSATDLRASFPTPTGDLTVGAGLQTFNVYVRTGGGGGGTDPDCRIELWETGGSTALAASAEFTVTSDSGQNATAFTWNANLLASADGSGVEIKVVSTRSGGSPGGRRHIDVGAIEWVADYTATPAETAPAATATATATAYNATVDIDANARVASFLDLPGASGDFAHTPDTAAKSVTGDIDIRAHAALDSWASPGGNMTLVAKRDGAADRSYWFHVTTGGFLKLSWSVAGATLVAETSDVKPSTVVSDGEGLHVRVTLDVSTGDTIFYTSSDGQSWSQLGTTRTGVATSIYDGTAHLTIGAINNTGSSAILAGEIYSAQVYSDLTETTLVADFNPSRDADPGDATFSSTTTSDLETWTIAGSASLTNWPVTATAHAATVGIQASAGTASTTATAHNPTVDTTSSAVEAPAGNASATATAYSANVSVAASAGNATATATAYNPTVAISTSAGTATATATGHDPAVSVSANAGAGTATATAYNATVAIGISAGNAVATATVQKTWVAPFASSPLLGLITRDAADLPSDISVPDAPVANDEAFRGYVVDVTWDELQPGATSDPVLAASNPIDTAITEVTAWNDAYGTAGTNQFGFDRKLKIRLFVGAGVDGVSDQVPAWVYTEADSFTFYRNGTAYKCPKWWTTTGHGTGTIGDGYKGAYDALIARLVTAYDGVGVVAEITVSAGMTLFAEPMVRNIGDTGSPTTTMQSIWGTPGNLTGYNLAGDIQAQKDGLTAHAGFTQTWSYIASNPFQAIDDTNPLGACTYNSTTGEWTSPSAHGLANDDLVLFTGIGTLGPDTPGTLAADTFYWVLTTPTTTTFTLADAKDGTQYTGGSDSAGTWTAIRATADLSITTEILDHGRNELGPKLVVGNNSMRWKSGDVPWATGDMLTLYENIAAYGTPIGYQTAGSANVFDLGRTIQWLICKGAQSIEAPGDWNARHSGGTDPYDIDWNPIDYSAQVADGACGAPARKPTATATAHNATVAISTSPTAATATATAYNATITTSGETNASAGSASTTATAHNPTVAIGATAGTATGTATAQTPDVSLSDIGPAGLASATATAHNPTVTTTSDVNAAAGEATATTTAQTPTTTITFTGGSASATATAYNATVTTSSGTDADAGNASVGATAYDATVTAVDFVTVDVENAAATATAYNATVTATSTIRVYIPPTTSERPHPRLGNEVAPGWGYRVPAIPKGYNVVSADGVTFTVSSITNPATLEAAAFVALGGHQTPVTAAQEAAIIASGVGGTFATVDA